MKHYFNLFATFCLLFVSRLAIAGPQVTVIQSGTGLPVTGLALSPDGKTIALTRQRSRNTDIVDLTTCQQLKTVSGGMSTILVEFSPDGKSLATSSIDFSININAISDGSKISSTFIDPGNPYDMKWLSDGTALAVAQSTTAALIDPQTGKIIASTILAIGDSAFSLALSPDENSMAIGTQNGEVFFFSTRKFSPPKNPWQKIPQLQSSFKLNPGTGAVKTLAYSVDGKMIFAGDVSGQITVWDIASQKKVMGWNTGESAIADLETSRDGKTIAVAAYNGNDKTAIQFWNIAQNKKVASWNGDAVTFLHWMPDSRKLLVGDETGKLLLLTFANTF